MNFNKLQAMQMELDNSILSAKPKMSAEERFNKTLVALSVEVAEVANCAEHFKFWKDGKGKVDEKRFETTGVLLGGKPVYFDNVNKREVKCIQAHQLTLLEECSDCLHFILSLANQFNYKISDDCMDINAVKNGNEKEEMYMEVVCHIARISKRSTLIIPAFIDLISDFLTYASLLGITTDELEQAYYEKNEENYRRLREGY